MSHLAPLISDLALILISAGIMTLLFKKLKQPLVLGYIVAGFVCSPHFTFTPSVVDADNIQTWSEIGVIFLLFALGLEFSFKKLMKVGGSAVISACTIIFCMILVGVFVGWMFGWKQMDCIYLGGMLAMSSTTIIYKAFDDLGLRQQRFAGLVLSILILEDILAIVLMVMLSTMAVSKNFEGSEMIYSIGKLVFFLILWFVVGIYLIPLFLKRARKLMSDETLLIVSLALCFGMVVLAARVGFSPAFGAFIMGSILAETVESEHIDKLVDPVKDLFGAIGMQMQSQGDALMIVSEKGLGKCTLISEFTTQNRGGKGVKCYKITEKTGNIVGVKAVNQDNELMLITTEGIIIRIKVSDTTLLGRITSGVKLINLDENVTVASIAKVREDKSLIDNADTSELLSEEEEKESAAIAAENAKKASVENTETDDELMKELLERAEADGSEDEEE
jgi:Kef-type K+ transport system membrane component KefB